VHLDVERAALAFETARAAVLELADGLVGDAEIIREGSLLGEEVAGVLAEVDYAA
jgi:hypothetical protein